jgi:DDE superfamily endonuclease
LYKAPRNRGKNTTLLASMSSEGMGPTLGVQGSTTKAVFEAYVERVLTPSLRPGQVVMDNLSAHKGEEVRESIEALGALPAALLAGAQPYRGSVLEDQGAVAQGGACTREALIEAMGAAIWAVTPREARGRRRIRR